MESPGNRRRRAFRSRHRSPMGEGWRIAIIVISAALVLFVLAVLLGTYLRGLAENDPYATDDSGNSGEVLTPADAVKARAVIFGVSYKAAEGTVTGDADTSAPETESPAVGNVIAYDAVSVTLRAAEADGYRLAYRSPIAERYGYDAVGALSLGEGMAIIRSDWGRNVHISGVFEVSYPSDGEDTRLITREYEAALLCEIAESGFDDIILVGFGDEIDEGMEFVRDLRERTGKKTVFGLAVSFELCNSEGATERLRELSQGCGLLALDLYTPEIPLLMSAEDYIADRVTRASGVIDKYNIRVLVDRDGADSLIKSALSSGAYSAAAVGVLPDAVASDVGGESTT